MPRTFTVCRAGISVAAAVVVLTACGGSDNAAGSSSSSSTSSSPSETGAPAADSTFCTQAAAVEQRISATFTGQSDPNTLPTVLQEATAEIRAITPPEELSADWTTFANGIEQIAAAAQIDFKDPNALAAFQQKVGALQQQYGSAFANVQNYLSTQCGLATPTESASPTS